MLNSCIWLVKLYVESRKYGVKELKSYHKLRCHLILWKPPPLSNKPPLFWTPFLYHCVPSWTVFTEALFKRWLRQKTSNEVIRRKRAQETCKNMVWIPELNGKLFLRLRSHDAGTFWKRWKIRRTGLLFTRKRHIFCRQILKTADFENGTLIGTFWKRHRVNTLNWWK